jgi:YidC/Oxa1 family membrane protein insertase
MAPPAQPGEQGAQMTQAMNMYMPLLMGYLALTFASGLSLYFIAGNIISIVQYALMGKVNWSNLIPSRLKIPGLPGKASTPEAIVESKPEKTTKKSSSGTTSKKASAKK